jgi:hypothetical protein
VSLASASDLKMQYVCCRQDIEIWTCRSKSHATWRCNIPELDMQQESRLTAINLEMRGCQQPRLPPYAKKNRNEDYGGLLTVLMFDHCQLSTVKGLPLYHPESGTDMLTTAQKRGLRLYRATIKVVYLEENMRFAEDSELRRWLACARVGNWTDDCRAFISTSPDGGKRDQRAPATPLQTISADNATRVSTTQLLFGLQCVVSPRSEKYM